jgi:serine protease AprX
MAGTLRKIVELRVPKSSSRSSIWLSTALGRSGISIDTDYSPVPVPASSTSLQTSLDAAQDHLVLVRGSIDLHSLDALRAHPSVVETYTDSQLAPFVGTACGHRANNWLLDVIPAPPTECPIPPCDCQPAQPHGTLEEVVSYLGVDQIWQEGVDGDGMVIGVIDGGISATGRTTSDLSRLIPHVIDGWPAANWGTIAGWNGHANMVAKAAIGIAPRAAFYDIRIAESPENGARTSDAITCLNWAIHKHRTGGKPQVLCCGWGINQRLHDEQYATDVNHPLTRKVVEAMDEGLLVLFAAGNGGQSSPARCNGTDTGPGNSIWGANGHPRVLTVGAVNKDEQLIGYSSQGPAALDEFKPDFCGISHFQNYFFSDSGTSVACAVAAGVVALLKQARPTLTQEAIKRLLKSTAKDIGPPGWDRHSGCGIISAKMAYDALVGQPTWRRADAARLQKLEVENKYLKELFVELALEKRRHRDAVNRDA